VCPERVKKGKVCYRGGDTCIRGGIYVDQGETRSKKTLWLLHFFRGCLSVIKTKDMPRENVIRGGEGTSLKKRGLKDEKVLTPR